MTTPLRLLAATLLVAPSLAQTLPPPAPPSAVAEEPVSLTAFTVTGSKDVGYTATNTLAGTRLNTPLNEVGTSISIVTKEFLIDLAATDSGTLLPYTVSTEVGGVDGNFAGGSISAGRAEQGDARTEPERNQRIRGLASAELTRNANLTDIPFDSYNTERVTLNRGPNALLFGIGSPGGIIDNATLVPEFGRDFYEAKLQLGERGTHRESFDFNRTIVKGRVAVRVAGLNKRTEYQQRPAWEKDQRIFGAITAVLAENRRSRILGPTTLRANAEYGDISANPPNTVPPPDGFTSWWTVPSRDLQRFTGTVFPAYYDNGTFVPQATIDPRTQAAVNTSIVTPYFLQFAAIYPGPGGPNQGLTGANAGLAGGQGRILWTGVPGRIQYNVRATQHAFNGGTFVGFDNPSIQDPNIFDFRNRLYTGETNRVTRDFQAQVITLEQGFWSGRAGLEVNYDYQRYRNTTQLPFNGGSADVRIDISTHLGNDQPNPNLGRPAYYATGLNQGDTRTDREAARATLFVTLDGQHLFGKGRAAFWFGKHTFTGMYFNTSIETRSRTFGHAYDAALVDLTSLLANSIDQFRRQVGVVAYVGPSQLATKNPGDMRLQPIDIVLPRDGDRQQMFYFDPATRTVRNAELIVRRYLNNANIGRREIESSVASVQNHWLGGHIITIGGLRRDTQDTYERVNLNNDPDPATSDRLATGDFDPNANRLQSTPSDITKGQTVTWSIVGKYPEAVLGRLPLGADFRVFANRSENFSPVGVRRNVYNELQAPPSGTTKEYGLMLDLFGGKLSARANRFETAGEGFTNPALQTAINSAINGIENLSLQRMLDAQNSGYTLEQAGLSQVGITSFEQAYQEIINFLPETTRAARNLRIESQGNARRVVGNPIAGAVGTSSFVAKGWELDLTGNPIRGLRVSLNVARQETVKSNIAPEFQKFAAEMRANIDKSRLRDVFDSPLLGETNTYFNRFNNNTSVPLKAELTKEGTKSLEQREWRVNVVASYDFDGPLRGWGIGSGARWQSGVATGYPNTVTPDGIIEPDLLNPFITSDVLNGDAWLSYKRKIFHDRVAWRVQFNVRNLIGSDSLIPVTTNPDGRPAIVRIPPERQFLLTNTFRF